MKRVEYDPGWGWIARDRNGKAIFDENWRWNSRSVARSVCKESDFLAANPQPPKPSEVRDAGE